MAQNSKGQEPKHKEMFKVIFFSRGEVYEVYARQLYNSDLYGFIEIEELVFGERAQVVVDPSEEKLKNEFEGVTRVYIPMHAVLRIDEVAQEGVARITEAKGGGNVAPFPVPVFKPKGGGK